MAHINIHNYVGIGLDFSKHTATTYQIAKDSEFMLIIDQSIRDTQHKEIWYSQLPKRPEDGPGYYSSECKLYARFKLHFGDSVESPWCDFILDNQREQDVVITNETNPKRAFTNSRDLEWEIPCNTKPSKPFEETVNDIYGQLGLPPGVTPGGDVGGGWDPNKPGSGNGGYDPTKDPNHPINNPPIEPDIPGLSKDPVTGKYYISMLVGKSIKFKTVPNKPHNIILEPNDGTVEFDRKTYTISAHRQGNVSLFIKNVTPGYDSALVTENFTEITIKVLSEQAKDWMDETGDLPFPLEDYIFDLPETDPQFKKNLPNFNKDTAMVVVWFKIDKETKKVEQWHMVYTPEDKKFTKLIVTDDTKRKSNELAIYVITKREDVSKKIPAFVNKDHIVQARKWNNMILTNGDETLIAGSEIGYICYFKGDNVNEFNNVFKQEWVHYYLNPNNITINVNTSVDVFSNLLTYKKYKSDGSINDIEDEILEATNGYGELGKDTLSPEFIKLIGGLNELDKLVLVFKMVKEYRFAPPVTPKVEKGWMIEYGVYHPNIGTKDVALHVGLPITYQHGDLTGGGSAWFYLKSNIYDRLSFVDDCQVLWPNRLPMKRGGPIADNPVTFRNLTTPGLMVKRTDTGFTVDANGVSNGKPYSETQWTIEPKEHPYYGKIGKLGYTDLKLGYFNSLPGEDKPLKVDNLIERLFYGDNSPYLNGWGASGPKVDSLYKIVFRLRDLGKLENIKDNRFYIDKRIPYSANKLPTDTVAGNAANARNRGIVYFNLNAIPKRKQTVTLSIGPINYYPDVDEYEMHCHLTSNNYDNVRMGKNNPKCFVTPVWTTMSKSKYIEVTKSNIDHPTDYGEYYSFDVPKDRFFDYVPYWLYSYMVEAERGMDNRNDKFIIYQTTRGYGGLNQDNGSNGGYRVGYIPIYNTKTGKMDYTKQYKITWLYQLLFLQYGWFADLLNYGSDCSTRGLKYTNQSAVNETPEQAKLTSMTSKVEVKDNNYLDNNRIVLNAVTTNFPTSGYYSDLKRYTLLVANDNKYNPDSRTMFPYLAIVKSGLEWHSICMNYRTNELEYTGDGGYGSISNYRYNTILVGYLLRTKNGWEPYALGQLLNFNQSVILRFLDTKLNNVSGLSTVKLNPQTDRRLWVYPTDAFSNTSYLPFGSSRYQIPPSVNIVQKGSDTFYKFKTAKDSVYGYYAGGKYDNKFSLIKNAWKNDVLKGNTFYSSGPYGSRTDAEEVVILYTNNNMVNTYPRTEVRGVSNPITTSKPLPNRQNGTSNVVKI